MNEYPIPIASDSIVVQFEHLNEARSYDWALSYVAEGQYQLKVKDQDGAVAHNRNFIIESVMRDRNPGYYRIGTSFRADGVEYNTDRITPTEEQLTFMLRVFVHSNPYYDDGRDLDFCEECDNAIPVCMEEHVWCANCEEQAPEAWANGYDINGVGVQYLCNKCEANGYSINDLEDIESCMSCEEYFDVAQSDIYYRTVIGTGEGWFCDDCVEDMYSCVDCADFGDYEHFNDDEYGDMYCNECRSDGGLNDGRLIKEWNYRPEMIFHPSIPVNPLKPLYIGMELEIQWVDWNYDDAATPWLEKVVEEYDEVMYVKSDSSISHGFELVTHPMSPEWALENFPFHMLDEAMEQGAEERHHSTGMHIHIDRGALTTAQLWKIIKVHEKLRELCGIVGGRGTGSDYADWDNGFKKVTENAFRISRKKGEAYGSAARYVPLNLQNEDTIELRYMEGSIKPTEIRKNIQWVQAMYDFTDHISVEDVKNGVLDGPRYMLGWILDQQSVYPDLAGYLKPRIMAPAAMPDRRLVCA